MERFTAVVGAVGFLGATAVVSYIAVIRTGDPAVTALGALIALTSAGAGYFLRGKVQNPEAGQVTLSADAPATASIRTAPAEPDVPVRPAEIVQPPRPPRDI